ncbi:MAG: cadherin-like beta sandwich domain-containing protein, partial [Lachnospiraceae bacterium]|nr:cadherin-like beta sandwich domain-containing protein [Lachnospiraceae bacterium]
DPAVTVGDEVNVTMKISADEGTALSNANVMLKYPADRLEFISGTDADGGAGTIRVHGTSNGGGTAVLEYNLKFRTASAGTFNVTIDSYEVYDGDDLPIEFTHLGNSTVTVNAQEEASTNCDLNSLEVYPGTLEPAFTADNFSYTVNVGENVDKLTVNAITADNGANVRMSGNEGLEMGENTVTVTVVAGDGTTTRDYVITVNKQPGGPDSTMPPASTPDVIEGVQLSSKGKTITIMNPTEDVEIPEGFRQGTIKIDDQKVQGWVWGADEDPQYCVVYGMNDKGELNFYRYDMVEKTIQRYFSDPLAANSVSNREYSELQAQKDEAERTAEIRFLLICILGVVAFVLAMLVIYLTSRVKSAVSTQKMNRRSEGERYARAGRGGDRDRLGGSRGRDEDDGELSYRSEDDTKEFLRHDFEEHEEEPEAAPVDETQVIRRPERKRRLRSLDAPIAEEPKARETEAGDDIDSDFEDLDI